MPSATAALFPVSYTTSPFGWSMTHMLIGITMSRSLSFGMVGIRPDILKGPNLPLVVQYTPLTCANPADGMTHSMPSSAATNPSLLIGLLLV